MNEEAALMNLGEPMHHDEKKTQQIVDMLLSQVNVSYDQAVLLAETAVSLANIWTTLSHLAGKRESLLLHPLCTASRLSTEQNAHGTPRYRALHGIDVSCPMHGTPAPGGRLRPRLRACDVYDVRAAMDRWQQLAALDHHIYTLHEQLCHLEKVILAASINLDGMLSRAATANNVRSINGKTPTL